ncbi:MAG: SPFH domain-containing protein [Eubacteriales bacterium]|nr:SPFH domain-containing protein [Eubacteriales bacterium]MDD3880753.1 SPFH domain-containing protein [Eubacteriales bacterium]MDD3882900.1 SPFH domain-containing protein [Eubacteriales bacterium]MDD4511614.1 SPFH domain-containing protein [Eubacteriales bacterium]
MGLLGMGVFGTIALVLIILLVLLFGIGYLKAPPDTAFVISGLGKKRILIGKAGWRFPFLERVDKLSLKVMTVDVKTSEAVPTNEFINVMVDGVANVKISSDPVLLTRAAESLLNMRQPELVAMITQVLEGNMREIVGSVGLKEMVQDRQGVAKKITENVVPDMQKLGMEVVNFNIQNFRDNAGTIENMGIDNVEQIRKNAQIAKANAQRDIAIATSLAQQEANVVKVDAEKKMAEQDAALSVQQAEMKVKADSKRAEADAAYSIQQENQRKTIEITKADADIAQREKQVEVAQKEIAIKERKLEAEIMKAADAAKYQAERQAEAELVRRQREAEAEKYDQIQAAEARKAMADADKYEAERMAEAKKAEADAARYSMEQEAEGIRAKGLAEAEAIEKKAEAQRKMGEASVLEMYLNALPEVVKNAAAPLAQTDRIVMYGDGNATKLVKDVMNSSGQIIDGLKESTGIDITSLIAGFAGGSMASVKNAPAIPAAPAPEKKADETGETTKQ